MTLSLALVFLFEEDLKVHVISVLPAALTVKKVRKNIAIRQIKFPLKLRNSVERQIKFPLNFKKIVNRQIKFPPNMPIFSTAKLNSRQNFFP